MRVVPLLILLCCAYVNQADEDSLARLLASKNILNLYLVAGHDLTVEYKIFNIGNRYVLAQCLTTIRKYETVLGPGW